MTKYTGMAKLTDCINKRSFKEPEKKWEILYITLTRNEDEIIYDLYVATKMLSWIMYYSKYYKCLLYNYIISLCNRSGSCTRFSTIVLKIKYSVLNN